MGLRELLILLLGLAIVAVILRGLYVALQARRGQIRLAIDKNIPQDVDLEALELAELPGGGARVVKRSGDEEPEEIADDPISRANERAETMALGRDDQAVPVLMDSVQVGSPDFADDDSEDEQLDEPEAEDADDVLFDYQANESPVVDDGMSSVQPDYPDDEFDDDQLETAHAYEEDETHDETHVEACENDFEEDYADDEEDSVDEVQSRVEPSFNADGFGDELESFSMTAGERIGGNPRIDSQDQTSMFAAAEEEPASPPGKRKSLFSALSSRIRSQVSSLRETTEVDDGQPPEEQRYEDHDIELGLDAEDSDLVEPELPESIPTEQLDIESSLAEEAQDPDPEPVEIQRAEPVPTELRAQSSGAQRTEVKQQETSSQSSEVLVLNVMAHEGREFRGEDLMHTIITSGMKFGDMQIFHHRFGNGSSGPVIFSLANILNPGTFDLNNMSQFSTIGVSLFMAMPTPINNLDAFEQMLAVARQLCTTLDGELKDDHRNVMTAQTIEHYRQRIRDFELRQLKTAGSRG